MRVRSPAGPGVFPRWLLLLGLASLPGACGDDLREAAPGAAANQVALSPSVVIGEADGDPAYLFGDIWSVAVDETGHVYVGDRIGATVRVYSSEGEFIGEVAGGGQGPGEIDGWPAHLAVGPRGRLYIRDASRVTVLAPREPGGPADSLAEVWTLAMYGNLTEDRSRVDEAGVYHYPNGAYRADEPSFFYLLLEDGRLRGDTLRLPPHPGLAATRPAFYRVSEGTGRMVEGFSRVPFAAAPSWDVTNRGTLVSTAGNRPQLIETGLDGDTIRVIALRDSMARPVPAAERADSLRALEERIDSLPVPLEEVMGLGEGIPERELPAVLPFVLSVSVGADDRLWIERWPLEGRGDVRRYDVLEPDGTHVMSVVLEAPLVTDSPPYFGRDAVVGVVRDESTGIERVVKFELGEADGPCCTVEDPTQPGRTRESAGG